VGLQIDKNAAYANTFKKPQMEEAIPDAWELQQVKYFNTIIQQDHQFIKPG
jgi:transposase-like protein